MRRLGLILMWGGFLITAFASMRESDRVGWPLYFALAMIGIAGVVILRRTDGAAAREVNTVRKNLGTLESSLAQALAGVRAVHQAKQEIDVYDLPARIDAEIAPSMSDFAEARESMIHGLGLAEYAEVMDHFARGERFLNRAWSASADGYVDEVWKSIQTAEAELEIADRRLREHLAS